MRHSRTALCLAAALLSALLLSACAKKEAPPAAPSPEIAAAEEPEIAPTEGSETLSEQSVAALDGIRALIGDGRYYEAFQKILALEEADQNEAERAACEELFAELDVHLREMEPATGTELERSFNIQGGGVLEVNAFSGPVLVTATDSVNLVRFYVRQGEVGETHLPAGTYWIGYQVGYRWFGSEIGFGEYCTEGKLEEPLYFDFYMDGQWASNAKFTITL